MNKIADDGKWLGAREELEAAIGRRSCCRYDTGGSHYHCGNCGGNSSMMGHFFKLGNETRHSFHCPENPQIASWDDE